MFSTLARDSWSLPDLQPLPGASTPNRGPYSIQANSPDRLLQYAYAVIQHTLLSGSLRGQIIREALESLQRITIRLRKTNPLIPPFSETKTYFWIQVVHGAIQLFRAAPENSTTEKSILDIPSSRLSAASFNALFDLNPDTWKDYYSEGVWNSIAARMAFVPPDIKPLPNVITIASKSQEHAALFNQMGSALLQEGSGLPSIECLSFQAIWTIKDANAFVQSSMADSPTISSHSHLLLYLYRRFFVGHDNDQIRNIALKQIETISGAQVDSVTQKTFWTQMFLIAVTRTRNKEQLTDRGSSKERTISFEELVLDNIYLVYENLHCLYYTPEIWNSEEASAVMIAPDKRSMPGFIASPENNSLDDALYSWL